MRRPDPWPSTNAPRAIGGPRSSVPLSNRILSIRQGMIPVYQTGVPKIKKRADPNQG